MLCISISTTNDSGFLQTKFVLSIKLQIGHEFEFEHAIIY